MFLAKSLFKLCYHPLRAKVKPCPWSLIKYRTYAYDGPGKTTATILNKEKELGFLIDTYSKSGFRLNNGVLVLGPIILFPRAILSWNIDDTSNINSDSLTIFHIIEPKIDVLIIGMGDKEDAKLQFEALKLLISNGTSVEILSTAKAVGTYNFLVAEGRNVAAALIPPYKMEFTDDDLISSSIASGKYNKSLLSL